MKLVIPRFDGIVPRQPETQLTISQATVAHDVRLRDGRLEAWREPCLYHEFTETCIAFYLHGCELLPFRRIVSVADGGPDWGHLYITGNTSYPQVYDLQTKTFSRLGVPAPGRAPNVTSSSAGSCDRESDARSYVYTYVNRWGEESAPSPPSPPITVADGKEVLLTFTAPVPDNYEIAEINIYRSVTGFRAPNVQQQSPSTNFLYVDTVPADTYVYSDKIKMVALGPVLETDLVLPPPDDLNNIVAIPEDIRLAGSSKNRIYFSERFELHNWPVKYELTLDSTIVHLGVWDRFLFATTDTQAYVIEMQDDDSTVVRIKQPLPDIACKYAHAAISTPRGFIYASPNGLILLKADGSFENLTAPWYNQREWADILPDTVRLGVYGSYLFCVTDRVTLLFELSTTPPTLCTLSDRPVDLLTSNTGDLYFLADNCVWVWDKGLQYRPFRWESRKLLTTSASTRQRGLLTQTTTYMRGVNYALTSAAVGTEDTEFTLISARHGEEYRRKVLDRRPFRLPRCGRHPWYKVRLRGIRPVEYVNLATSYFTLHHGE